jgi:hypothetical protein
MHRHLQSSALQVDSGVDGRLLAAPFRRALAFAIDVALLLLPSILVAFAAGLATLAIREPAGFDAAWKTFRDTTDDPAEERVLRGHTAALLVRLDAEGVPPAIALAVEEGNLDRAADILEQHKLVLHLGSDAAPLPPGTIRLSLDKVMPGVLRSAALFGVAALYFTFLTAGGRRTIGKRLVGTRVLKLDGQPLTVWESFERFGGYFAALGTFGLGARDLWRDPNRRMAHDRMASTVVVAART